MRPATPTRRRESVTPSQPAPSRIARAEQMDAQRDDRSLGQLFGDLTRQLGTLVRKEIELARTEMTTRVTTVGRDAAMLGAGGALAYAALLVALIAVALLLIDIGLTPWLAFLIVAARAEERRVGN